MTATDSGMMVGTGALAHPPYAWLDGEMVPFEDCKIHARTQGAFWGANVFEGVRGYWNAEEGRMRLFRLDDHLARLEQSMKCIGMPQPFPRDRIAGACHALLAANGFQEDVHIVVVAYFRYGARFDPLCYTDDVGLHITALPWPRNPKCETGVRAMISSWRRISDETMPPRIKTGANYHNSRLAQHEAVRSGFDTAILINSRGTVAEGPGACIVAVTDGAIRTPSPVSGVLESITVKSVFEIARGLGHAAPTSTEIDRTELYLADEVMICGTLAEIVPIVQVDGVSIGDGRPGPVARQLQAAYDDAVRGRTHPGWSEVVDHREGVPA